MELLTNAVNGYTAVKFKDRTCNIGEIKFSIFKSVFNIDFTFDEFVDYFNRRSERILCTPKKQLDIGVIYQPENIDLSKFSFQLTDDAHQMYVYSLKNDEDTSNGASMIIYTSEYCYDKTVFHTL